MAKLIGVGVGPGDPELITLKAARYIQQTSAISYITNLNGDSQARNIAAVLLTSSAVIKEIPIMINMYEERSSITQCYDQAAMDIKRLIQQGEDVVFLCEGDPLFFGSFAYILERLHDHVECEVVPGISSIHAASSALQLPLAQLQDSFAVVSGRHDQTMLQHTLKNYDSVVILKAGNKRQAILKSLAATGRSNDAYYLEYIGRDNEKIYKNIHELDNLEDKEGPYFSLFVVTNTRSSKNNENYHE